MLSVCLIYNFIPNWNIDYFLNIWFSPYKISEKNNSESCYIDANTVFHFPLQPVHFNCVILYYLEYWLNS